LHLLIHKHLRHDGYERFINTDNSPSLLYKKRL